MFYAIILTVTTFDCTATSNSTLTPYHGWLEVIAIIQLHGAPAFVRLRKGVTVFCVKTYFV